MNRTMNTVAASIFCTALVLLTGCGPTSDSATATTGAGTTPANTTTKATVASVSTDPAPNNDNPDQRDGTREHPLRMIIAPIEGRAADRASSGIQPLLDAIREDSGIYIEPVTVPAGYATFVEGLATRKGDIAGLGPYAYLEARKRHAAELLAVPVQQDGTAIYFSGIFCRRDANINSIKDLKGHSCAFGDPNSTSSFNYPCAMMLNAGVDPTRDLSKVVLSGSHENSLAALAAGKVDACCASIGIYENAVKAGRMDPKKFKLLAQSEPIPWSPIVMHPSLPAELKTRLKVAMANASKNPKLKEIRGEDGKKADHYDTTITDKTYDRITVYTRKVTEDFKAAMLQKAATRG